jgi:t-SNARE complex subunit (syntaxin)
VRVVLCVGACAYVCESEDVSTMVCALTDVSQHMSHPPTSSQRRGAASSAICYRMIVYVMIVVVVVVCVVIASSCVM